MSKVPIQRMELIEYLNQCCVCRAKVFRKTHDGICLSSVFINDLYLNHLWVAYNILKYFPKNEWVYFTGIVAPYRKRNYTTISYSLIGIKIITKGEYDKKSLPFKKNNPKKPLKHIQKSITEKMNKWQSG